jgi:hypothetical protein
MKAYILVNLLRGRGEVLFECSPFNNYNNFMKNTNIFLKNEGDIISTIYLDQNVIDAISKKRINLEIPDNARIIYSTENLNEINRARINSKDGAGHLPYLDVLHNLNAIYISYEPSDPYITDKRRTWVGTPKDIFKEFFLKNASPYHSIIENMNLLVHKYHGGDKLNNYDPIKKFREEYSLSPGDLNKIKAPYIKNICCKKKISIEKMNEVLDDFIKKCLPVENCLTLKINLLYSALNIVGFYPDKNIRDMKAFTASLSDNSHACYANFSCLFLTADKKMYKKISAVYEYLGIKTICKLIDF